MAVTTTTIQRSGQAIEAALADLSPPEAEQFRLEYRDALTRAADTFDLTEAETVLSRWWGIANIRANPLTAAEQNLIERFRAGEDVGWSSPRRIPPTVPEQRQDLSALTRRGDVRNS